MENKVASASFCILGLLLVTAATKGAQAGIWLDVPFVKQEKNLCGAACVSMVMQYWAGVGEGGLPAESPSVTEIGKALYSEKAGGIFGKDMERYFQERGFQTFVFQGEWTDLENHLSKGRPLIACLEGSAKRAPFHYVVIAGLDLQQDLILVNDPSQRKLLKLSRTSFERGWNQTAHWTLLALPRPSSHRDSNPSHENPP